MIFGKLLLKHGPRISIHGPRFHFFVDRGPEHVARDFYA